MKSYAYLFICSILLWIVSASEPKTEEVPTSTNPIALQTALKRLGLTEEWYTTMLALSQPIPPLEMPGYSSKPIAVPVTQPREPSSLLQEGTRARVEAQARVQAEAQAQAEAEAGVGTGANPTYILPQNPWASNYPFPAPSPFAYNSYAPVAYGYSQPYANPSYAPGGGGGGGMGMGMGMGGGGGIQYAPSSNSNIAAPTNNDYFASAPVQPGIRDPSFIYPAPNFVNPLYVSPRMPNGAFSYYAGFASAIPQGPLSDPTPFPVGDNPPNNFPGPSEASGAAAPAQFTELSSAKESDSLLDNKLNNKDKTIRRERQQRQQYLQRMGQPLNNPPQKRFFRPDIQGEPSKDSMRLMASIAKRPGGTRVVSAEEYSQLQHCDNCHFEE